MYYFDTCALVKAYHSETGSETVVNLLNESIATNFVSQIVFTEFYCTLYKKLRTHEIRYETDILKATRRFEIALQFTNVIAVDEVIFSEARNLIMKRGTSFSLKTLDAIHLTSFVQLAHLNPVTFVSSDKKLCGLVTEMGYKVINPLGS